MLTPIKSEKVYKIINTFLSYFHVLPFFEGNNNLFFITFYFFVVLLIILTLLIFYLIVNSSKPQNKFLRTSAKIYRMILSLCSGILFLPIVSKSF